MLLIENGRLVALVEPMSTEVHSLKLASAKSHLASPTLGAKERASWERIALILESYTENRQMIAEEWFPEALLGEPLPWPRALRQTALAKLVDTPAALWESLSNDERQQRSDLRRSLLDLPDNTPDALTAAHKLTELLG